MTRSFAADERSWSDKRGNQTVAVLLGLDGGKAVLEKASGKKIRIDIGRFSEADQPLLRNAKPFPAK